MRTIAEVIAMFPSTRPNQWRQHENGKGWVFETAHVADSAYMKGIVYGNAQVSGDAWVYGNAQVSGDARVYGNAWEKSPLYIQGSRHAMTLCSRTEIAIGCHIHKITEWRETYKAIGKAEGYTPAEIKEYGEYIALMARAARKLARK